MLLREFRDGGGGIVGELLFEVLTLCDEFDGVLVCFVVSFFFLDYGCLCKFSISVNVLVFFKCTSFCNVFININMQLYSSRV